MKKENARKNKNLNLVTTKKGGNCMKMPREFLVIMVLSIMVIAFGTNVHADERITLDEPSELTAKVISANGVQLNWIDRSVNEEGFVTRSF